MRKGDLLARHHSSVVWTETTKSAALPPILGKAESGSKSPGD